MDQVKAGKSPYHFIEVMACPVVAWEVEDSHRLRPGGS